jgi:hypothetical protein
MHARRSRKASARPDVRRRDHDEVAHGDPRWEGDYALLDYSSSSCLRWFRQAGALVLFGIFVIGIIDCPEAVFKSIPKSTESSFSGDFPIVGISDPSHCIESCCSYADTKNNIHRKRRPVQAAQCAALSSFQNDERVLPIDFQFVVRRNHWQRRFSAMENTADKFDGSRSCSDIGQIKMTTKLLVGNEGNKFIVRDSFLNCRLPDDNLANDDLWPLPRNELFTSETNRLTRQPSLDASAYRQDNRKGRNNDGSDGSDGGSGFRRPIHWDSFTFYTTLGGLLSFATIYAGILLYVARDRRQ